MTGYKGRERRAEVRSRRESDTGWHLDRKVPVAIILALVVQFGGFVWVAAHLDAQVAFNSKSVARLAEVPERLMVLETLMRRVETTLERRVP